MAFATPENLISRYDVRKLGQLVRDDNTQATAAELLSDSVLSDALEDATAQIRSAATINDKYTEDDLSDLAAGGDPFLIRLTCNLAMGYLLNRRTMGVEALPPEIEQANEWLAALRFGSRIFNIAKVRRFGNVQRRAMTADRWGETALVADKQRYFPGRGQR